MLYIGQWQEIDCPNRPPPIGAFTFIEIDPDHALLFGGRVEETRMNHVYILNMKSMVSGSCDPVALQAIAILNAIW